MINTQLFGVPLSAGDMRSATEQVLALAASATPVYVCIANVDMVTRAKRDSVLMSTMQGARLVVTDGMPLVWALRRQGMDGAERVYGPDLMLSICAGCERQGEPIFLYGGTQAEIDALRVVLNQRYPALRIAGAVAPGRLPDVPAYDRDTAGTISRSGARVIFVGLGCPKQEYWLRNNAAHLAGVSLGVGQAFAQIAGLKRRAPVWMAERGLEWLFRLVQEPRRLWRRYLVGNSLFVWYFLREVARRSSTPITPS